MFITDIENIDCPDEFGAGVAEGVHFLQGLAKDVAAGRYELSGGSYANVDCYATRRANLAGYEAHRQYIDIQYLLAGEERIKVRPISELRCTTPYDAERDVAFFADDGASATEVVIGNGQIAVLFPDDAHQPQLCITAPQEVKKVVVKVPVENK